MNDADRRLAAVAGQQRQVFTRAQARAAGLSFNGIRRRLESGALVVVGPRTLTFAGVALDWRGRLKAGLLDLGFGALVSAEAAAALHELDGFAAGPLVFLTRCDEKDRTTVGTVTSSTWIDRLDCTTVDGLAVTVITVAALEGTHWPVAARIGLAALIWAAFAPNVYLGGQQAEIGIGGRPDHELERRPPSSKQTAGASALFVSSAAHNRSSG